MDRLDPICLSGSRRVRHLPHLHISRRSRSGTGYSRGCCAGFDDRRPTFYDRSPGPTPQVDRTHRLIGDLTLNRQDQQRLAGRVFARSARRIDRTLLSRDPSPAARGVKRDHLFSTAEIPKCDAVGSPHRLRNSAHEPTPDALTPHSIRDQHSPHTADLDLSTADGYRLPRPANMTDDLPASPRDDMKGVGRIPVRHIGVPLTEVIQVLGIEESTQSLEVTGRQILVRNDLVRDFWHASESTDGVIVHLVNISNRRRATCRPRAGHPEEPRSRGVAASEVRSISETPPSSGTENHLRSRRVDVAHPLPSPSPRSNSRS